MKSFQTQYSKVTQIMTIYNTCNEHKLMKRLNAHLLSAEKVPGLVKLQTPFLLLSTISEHLLHKQWMRISLRHFIKHLPRIN